MKWKALLTVFLFLSAFFIAVGANQKEENPLSSGINDIIDQSPNEAEPINPLSDASLNETNNTENSFLDVNEKEEYNLTKIKESWFSSFRNPGIYIIESTYAPSIFGGIIDFVYYFNDTSIQDFTVVAGFPISSKTTLKLNDYVNVSKYISVVIAMGMHSTSGYWVSVESAWVKDNNITIRAGFKKPGKDALVLYVITYPVALVEIGNLAPENEYYATIELNLEGAYWCYIHQKLYP